MIIITEDIKLYNLAAFAAVRLNLIDEDLELDLEVKPDLKDLMFGYMIGDEDMYMIRVAEVDPVTVFHEMVHVDQYVRGRLVRSGGKAFWKGKLVPETVPYLDKPWEQEAESLAHVLKDMWEDVRCE
jgi:hypothetical protein